MKEEQAKSRDFSVFESTLTFGDTSALLPFTYYARQLGLHDSSFTFGVDDSINAQKEPPFLLSNIERYVPEQAGDILRKGDEESFVDLEWQSMIDESIRAFNFVNTCKVDLDPSKHSGLLAALEALKFPSPHDEPKTDLENILSPLTYYQSQYKIENEIENSDAERKAAKAWLRGECQSHAAQASEALFSDDTLYDLVLNTIRSSRNWESALFDLLGVENLTFIQNLLQQSRFLKILSQPVRKLKLEAMVGHEPNHTPSLGFHVHPDYPHVYMTQTCVPQFSAKWALPTDTVHVNEMDYEAFSIPATLKSPQHTRIPISSLPAWTHPVFPKYQSLNIIQSVVYPVVFNTNENMLVCAPTGAGKTDIALLAILRTIQQYKDEPYKIVYVAPMKALASEMVSNFSKRLQCLNVKVKEWTGDIQIPHSQLPHIQVLVTTPEKWDIVTRKAGDLVESVRLLLLDEVHLLHEDRGAVLECLVARTQRQVESSQSMIRIIGLSATLPNYLDVASFLRLDPKVGLFCFDAGYRPVPLVQNFIGVKGKQGPLRKQAFNRICFEKCRSLVFNHHQVMVFVHSRSETYASAMALRDLASKDNSLSLFLREEMTKDPFLSNQISKSKNRQLREVISNGMGIHHAGMSRSDRNLVEKLFRTGVISVLFCTSTLAWGVNLPAHAVIIKETEVYDTLKGKFVDLGILDVLQIFGRAGRPQYESEGEAFIMTTHAKLSHYISAVTQQLPIESQFITNIIDLLNAEVVLGTVNSISEGIQWLGYTYLYTRMLKNPRHYNVRPNANDPLLMAERRELVERAAIQLLQNNMVNYHEDSGFLSPKEIGRIASHFYIQHTTIAMVNQTMRPGMAEADILQMLCQCSEFSQIRLKEQESKSLDNLKLHCYCQISESLSDNEQKVNLLVQAYISNHPLEEFVSDALLIAQNAGRILRALFEYALHRKFMDTAQSILSLCKSVERRCWPFVHPLSQFLILPFEIIEKLEQLDHVDGIMEIREMSAADLGHLIHHQRFGPIIRSCAWKLPLLSLEVQLLPITSTILDIHISATCNFEWDTRIHGGVQVWWIWIEDRQGGVHHIDSIRIPKKACKEPHLVTLKLRLPDPSPSQLDINWISDTWFGAEETVPVTLEHIVFPDTNSVVTAYTDLLDLRPLPITALQDAKLEALYRPKFQFFNPIQTQLFHVLYYTQDNVLLGAPTGSGKTLAAELVMWQTFRMHPKSIVVYIAPMKALVRERVSDWRPKLHQLGYSIEEWTGDVSPESHALRRCDVIVTTPEKWDGVSRGWRDRWFVQKVRCVILDEIHLLGSNRGPVLETIVGRIRYLSQYAPVRLLGLSTALANPLDLAHWLDVPRLYNFRHNVRPVPLEVFIEGFSGKHYCPRMATMNKPCFRAILKHSPKKPALIFVSSRRQTRLTANAIIGLCCLEDSPKRFLHMSDTRLSNVIASIQDPSLAHALTFGIGLHHAGLVESDRQLVEELFVNMEIQVLVATATLAWGVNTPAHLVIVKGTEYFESKLKQYADFPITDVLQMMGRAGRPGYDEKGVACVLVLDTKKSFYKEFLHAPFPVESSLHKALHDPFNAEIASGTIESKQDALNYLSWTFLYIRLRHNPNYYGVESQGLEKYVSQLLDRVFLDLEKAGCISFNGTKVESTELGRIGSRFYVQYLTLQHYDRAITSHSTSHDLLKILSQSQEFSELPVRHNEDKYNQELARLVPIKVHDFESPHTKTHLLLQARFETCALPIVDYITDTQTVLDQCPRLLQTMLEICVWKRYTNTSFHVVSLFQTLLLGGIWPPVSLPLPSLEILKMQLESKDESLLCRCNLSNVAFASEPVEDAKKSGGPCWYFFVHDPATRLFLLKRGRFPTGSTSISVHFKEWKSTNRGTLSVLCDSIHGMAAFQIQGFSLLH